MNVRTITEMGATFYRHVIEQLPGLTAMLNHESKFVCTNNYTAKLMGYSDQAHLLGRDVSELRCPMVEVSDELFKQNQYVRENLVELTILDINLFLDQTQKILITKKSPLVIPGQPTGIICHSTEIQSFTLQMVASTLMHTDKQYRDVKQSLRSYSVAANSSIFELTERQLECVFYLLRGKTSKEIGFQLGITSRTVEAHLNMVKKKWNVTRKSMLIECAIHKGLLNYIPRSVIFTNTSRVLHFSPSPIASELEECV